MLGFTMTSKNYINIIGYLLILLFTKSLSSEVTETGLDISADKAETNLKTAISRLEGNVKLIHIGLMISGSSAEVQAASEVQPQIFVISGKPVKFEQKLDTSEMSASAQQLIYRPSEERMELQTNVLMIQKNAADSFKISAENLQIIFRQERPHHLDATGSPVSFSHQLAERVIQINAEKIAWNAETSIAIMKEATEHYIRDVRSMNFPSKDEQY
jgi:lipopolysaccharide transport protein LptA